MGLVLWIDQNTFATSLLEKVFKKKDLPFYTLESVENFSYLVDDLQPKLIVLDIKTAEMYLPEFISQYQASPFMQSIPFITLDGDMPILQNVVGSIKRPFNPFAIPGQIQSFL